MDELRTIATQMGLRGLRAESKQSLVARITLTMHPELLGELTHNGLIADKPKEDAMVAQSQTIKTPPKYYTVDEVMDAITKAVGPRLKLLKITFYDDADRKTTGDDLLSEKPAQTWHIQNGVAEDTGSMTTAPSYIAFRANELSRARHPAEINDPDFDKIKVNGRNVPLLG